MAQWTLGSGIYEIEAVDQPGKASRTHGCVLVLSGEGVQGVKVWSVQCPQHLSVLSRRVDVPHYRVDSGDPQVELSSSERLF